MSIFREYDIRGIHGRDLTCDVVFNIGRELAVALKNKGGKSVAVGHDARTHSGEICHWLTCGLAAGGASIYFMGMIPTPVAYFALYADFSGDFGGNFSVDSSIMITGSHNPPEYNGLKITMLKAPFFGEEIAALGAKVRESSETFRDTQPKIANLPALERYISYLTEHFAGLRGFKGKIAIDCGNGVAGVALTAILKNLGLDYLGLFLEPDGRFPNHHPDPSEEENLNDLKNAMKAQQIELGFAFDGDADRVCVVVQNRSEGEKIRGEIRKKSGEGSEGGGGEKNLPQIRALKGDELAILFAKKMQKDGLKPVVIGEVKCSSVMYGEIDKIGRAIMHKTGHSNLKVKLKETAAHLAAEMSGHLFFNDRYFGFDDAIYAALRALEMFLDSSVAEVCAALDALPKMHSTPEEKIKSSEEAKFGAIARLKTRLKNPPSDFPKILKIIDIDGVRVEFEEGWGLVRASNTTPVLVTRFEAKTAQKATLYKQKMLGLLGEG